MAKMTHSQKVKLARKLRTLAEQKAKVGLFSSNEWKKRKKVRQDKQISKTKKK